MVSKVKNLIWLASGNGENRNSGANTKLNGKSKTISIERWTQPSLQMKLSVCPVERHAVISGNLG